MPQIGRFLTVDPVEGGSASAYDYAGADPVNGSDLSGLSGNHREAWPCRGRIHAHTHHTRAEHGGYGEIFLRNNISCGSLDSTPKYDAHPLRLTIKFENKGRHETVKIISGESRHPDRNDVEFGNYKSKNPIVLHGCLQENFYKVYVTADYWFEGKYWPASELVPGEQKSFTMEAHSECRG